MAKVLVAWRLCLQNFRKWTTNPRIYVMICLLFIDLYYTSRNLLEYCQFTEQPVTPYLFPMLMQNDHMFLLLGLVLLFCDAPFLDEEQPYLLLRAGKKSWTAQPAHSIGKFPVIQSGIPVSVCFTLARCLCRNATIADTQFIPTAR